jgi:Na+-driven multidrug efflux pump
MFGAALSTIISLAIALILMIYWIYIKRDIYLKPALSKFQLNNKRTTINNQRIPIV